MRKSICKTAVFFLPLLTLFLTSCQTNTMLVNGVSEKDAIEIWEITNSSNISHPFHIHDISFKILSKTNGALAKYEKGWKDVVLNGEKALNHYLTARL